MAAKDKERYKDEMKDYTPPIASTGPGKKKDKGSKKKDPNAPKRAMTSFFFFSNEMRSKIKKENPSMSFGELGKKIGELFRQLSPEEKEKYEQMARDDKARFKKEMASYKNKGADDNDKEDDDADDADSDADGVDEAGDDDDEDDDSDDE